MTRLFISALSTGKPASVNSDRTCFAITESLVVCVRTHRYSGCRLPEASINELSVSSMRSMSSGDALTGTRRKSAAAMQANVAWERNPAVSITTWRPLAASFRAVLHASSEESSTTSTPPRLRSRAAKRAIERCGSASMTAGLRPVSCQWIARQLATVLLPLPPFIVATVMICLMVSLPLEASGESVANDANGFLACTPRGSIASRPQATAFPVGKRSFPLKFRTSGRSAATTGRRYDGLEHIKRLHANLTVGLVIGSNAYDISSAELLALSVDIERNAVVRRSADQPDGQAASTYDQRLIYFDVVGIFRRNEFVQCRL